jgi:phosphoribosylanthranilate isomerase
MFRIKICGITNTRDAIAAVDAGADAIGLNFYEKSSRYVTEQQVGQIGEGMGRERALAVVPVGVFVNHSISALWRHWTRGGDRFVVQLHGDESPEFVASVKTALAATYATDDCQLIWAQRLGKLGLEELRGKLAECVDRGAAPDALLIDSAAPGSYGGTGTVLAWERLVGYESQLGGIPVILAGGLTPDNVAEAIRIVRPAAVDVASGVESSPGKKDPVKVRDFVAAANEAFATLEREDPRR